MTKMLLMVITMLMMTKKVAACPRSSDLYGSLNHDDHDGVDDDGDNTEDFRGTGNQILKDVTATSGDRYVVVLMKREKTIRQNWEY